MYPRDEDRCPAPPNPKFDAKLNRSEREWQVNGKPIVPDHRVRRLQHLLADVVELADELSFTRLRRPFRRREPTIVGDRVGEPDEWIPCDCWWENCKSEIDAFWWRPKDVGQSVKWFSDSMALRREGSMPLARRKGKEDGIV